MHKKDSAIVSSEKAKTDTQRVKIEKLAKIENLHAGVNGTHIRFWFSYSNSTEYVISIMNKNKIWYGELIELNYKYKYDGIDTLVRFENDPLIGIEKKVNKIIPNSGWKYLLDSLIYYDFYNLPDMSSVKGYQIETDGNYVLVEIADELQYREYRYFEPLRNSKKFIEAGKIVKIMELLSNEFNFDFNRQSSLKNHFLN